MLLLRHEAQCYITRAAGRDERRYLSRDPARLGASLEEFVGHPAYGTVQLRQDLDRFVFLLGGDDGESLFGPDPAR